MSSRLWARRTTRPRWSREWVWTDGTALLGLAAMAWSRKFPAPRAGASIRRWRAPRGAIEVVSLIAASLVEGEDFGGHAVAGADGAFHEPEELGAGLGAGPVHADRKSTRLNSSHVA